MMFKESGKKSPKVAIIGAGLGGATTAALLQQSGFDITIYEQAPAFNRLGAGIHLGPNLVKVMKQIGIADELTATTVSLGSWISRKWDTGEVLLDYPIDAEERFGVPYLQAHRGDFHALLIQSLKSDTVQFGKRLVGLDIVGGGVDLSFEDGVRTSADVVIGADGIRSCVREVLMGEVKPKFTGQVAHRSIYPRSLLGRMNLPDYTKWWGEIGEDRMVNHYFLRPDRQDFYIYTSTPQQDWPHETSSVAADIDGVIASFKGGHPEMMRVLEAMPPETTSKWAQHACEPLKSWCFGPVALLGDAVHPMPPYLGQGAAMAIEDGAMLARCLAQTPADVDHAFKLYEANRLSRTAKVQATANQHHLWLRDDANPEWVFGYDVLSAPLEPVNA